ncbi:MAG: hypothetical protein OIF50_14750, partial [Flavobacteriaceae bacterium]|nr:hypothetical protein [Flavobacteriaceae bacterium]
DGDKDASNETITGASLSGTNLEITEAGTTTTVDLSSLNNSGTDDQNISGSGLSGTDLTIGIEGGTNETVSLASFATDAEVTAAIGVSDAADGDKDASNEIQTLSISGSDVSLSNGGGTITLPTSADDSISNELQNLNLAGTNLSISSGNSVNLSSINTDNQTIDALSLNAGTGVLSLSLENDGEAPQTVDLSGIDNQNANEVNLATNRDIDGDGTNETTVQAAVDAMAPIVSKAARVFYPPSIAININSDGTDPDTGTANGSKNLYTEYTSQFSTPAVSSAGAPAAIPTYAAGELYYYVTYYDTNVFTNVNIDANGVMTYTIVNAPSNYNTLINVVFVVK